MDEIIPLRGADIALGIDYSMGELMEEHQDINRTLEEAWAGLLTLLVRNWPDWPIELWSRLDEIPNDDPTEDLPSQYLIRFRLSFGGEGPSNSDVTAMLDVVTRGLRAVVRVEPELSWDGIGVDWFPLWAVDDGKVFRLLAPEATVENSVYMIGVYAGEPTLFAGTLEAWPLTGSRAALGIEIAEVDLGWAFTA